MSKVRVPLHGKPQGYATVDTAATDGASVGQNLRWADGSLVTEAQLRGAATPPEQGEFPITYWRLIQEIPPNVVALANRGTTGLYVITAPGASATRAIEVQDGELTVADGDGVGGNPLLGLAGVEDSGAGALCAIERDEFGRVTGTRPATITGTADEIDVADGDAAAGLPTISLADLADAGGGEIRKFDRDAKGRVSGTSAATTDDLDEGATNLYFTAARVRSTLLTGLSLASAAVISATDTVLSAIGKLQAQITALASSLSGYVPTSRTISTTAPLAGGGDLSADRTLSISAASAIAAGSMSAADKTKLDNVAAGATVGAAWAINLSGIPANITSWAGIDPTTMAPIASPVFSGKVGVNADPAALPNVYFQLSNALSTRTDFYGDGMSSSDIEGAAQFIFWGRSVNALSGSAEKRVGAFSFSLSGATAGHRGGLFKVALKGNNTTAITDILYITTSEISSGSDNSITGGSASRRYSQLYAATGTINTSDAREKTEPRDMTPAEIACGLDIARLPCIYQWLASIEEKGEEGARLHTGPTVQAVIATMEMHGLDPFRYSFVCYDAWPEQQEVVQSWEAEPEEVDEWPDLFNLDGSLFKAAGSRVIKPAREAGSEVVQEYRPAGDRYSLRPSGLDAFCRRALVAERDAMQLRIAALEQGSA